MIQTWPDRAAWLEARRQGIGASDAAVILGLSPWKSPLQLFAEKLGLEIEAQEQTEAMTWGLRLQPVIAEAYGEETGRAVTLEPPYQITQSPDYPWMLASLDAWTEVPERVPLEVKMTSAFRAEDWAEAPPLYYQVQVQHQVAVAGTSSGAITCLIGGNRLVWADLERNDAFIERLIRKEQEFWARVEAKDPPEPDASKASAEILRRLYPKETPGTVITLPPEMADWDDMLQSAKAKLKVIEAQKRLAENQIRAALGEAEAGRLPDGTVYQWKARDVKGYEVQPRTDRVLTRKEPTA